MSHCRALLRLPLMFLATAALFALWVLSRPLGWLKVGFGRASHFWIVRTWARTLGWILRVKIEVFGEPARAPHFLVSNHLSYLDVIVLFSVVDGFFVAKSEVASWPVLGFLARSTGTIFIDRSRKSDLRRVTPLIEKVLSSGANVIVFPEGTSTQGTSVLPFKPSMFEAAVQGSASVAATSLTYRTPQGEASADLAVCWWGDMTFMKHAYQLVGLKRIEAVVTFFSETIEHDDRKGLALAAQQAVESIFTPVASATI